MKKAIWLVLLVALLGPAGFAQQSFTLEQVMSTPFPEGLVAAKSGNRFAWIFNEQGKRNIWVAEGHGSQARRLTSYLQDDGQELSELAFSPDAATIVYVRGGGKNSAGASPNPTSNPAGAEQDVWAISWNGGEPRKIDAGHDPVVSKTGWIAYARDAQLYVAPLGGSAKPEQLVVRGKNTPIDWSPDGSRLLFVSDRGDHSFVAVYDSAAKSIRYMAPTVDTDSYPVWSLDGKKIAFVRQPAVPRDTPEGYFIAPDRPHPWSVWVADPATGAATLVWSSGDRMQDSFPYMANDTGGGVLNWAAGDQLVIASESDGWQHLYSLPSSGGTPKLLTPGDCEVEQWSFTPNRTSILYNSNCGDIDRRHLWLVGVDGAPPLQWSSGKGIEWSATVLSDGQSIVYFASDAAHPARVYASSLAHHPSAVQIAPGTWPGDFPSGKLVAPEPVIYTAADGQKIHAQMFLPANERTGEKHPAAIFIHGGSMRQMLLGWHYMYYYSNAYAMNQYLASRGYVVLAINYRSGIGYGRAFREAPGRAGRGASEYQDVVAAGKYLQSRADVDPQKVALWGGSYGGYLTALGLGRNSDIFAAGVDMHGVHDWPTDNWDGKNISPEETKLAHDSSPVTAVDTWKSPVLFIHGDDDRNVMFSQTVDLVARLRERNVPLEQLIFPDEIHDFLLHRTWLRAYHATAEFLGRKFNLTPSAPAGNGNTP